MPKSVLMALMWFVALVLSAGVHWWGQQRPQPLDASWPVALSIVLLPPFVIGLWLLLTATDDGRRESGECDQETH